MELRLWRTTDINHPHTELFLHLSNNMLLTISHVSLRHIHLIPTQAMERFPSISQAGVDVLSTEFSYGAFKDALVRTKGTIKSFLLNQKYLAGLGNTYIDEILFFAGLDPRSDVNNISEKLKRIIFETIRKELRKGLKLGGSSEMNYVDLYGNKGKYQEQVQVKHRKGKPCFRCRTAIERIVLIGRGSYFCPRCQELL